MARPLRIKFEGAWYHVMNRGAGRKNIFNTDEHFSLFRALLKEITERFSIEVHAYCLMDNHYHLLLCTPKPNLSRAMRHLDGVYTQKYNKSMHTDGPLFRGRYKSILVDADAYLLQLSRYIHLNPVEAGIVEKPEHYLWSSYSSYIHVNKRPDCLHYDETLNQFPTKNKILMYEKFVSNGVDRNLSDLFSKQKMPAILGHAAFIQGIKNKIINYIPASSDISESKQLHKHFTPSLDIIIDQVAQYYFVHPQAIKGGRSRQGANTPRKMAITIAALHGGYSYREITEVICSGGYHAIAKVVKRFKEELDENKQLSSDFRKIIESMLSLNV